MPPRDHSKRTRSRLRASGREVASALAVCSNPARAGGHRARLTAGLSGHVFCDDTTGAGAPAPAISGAANRGSGRHLRTWRRDGALDLPRQSESQLDRRNALSGRWQQSGSRFPRESIGTRPRAAWVTRRPAKIDGRLIIVEGAQNAQYRLLILAPPPFNVWSFVPYYVLILAAVVLLCWLIALTIVRPIRQLAGAVDRFGSGDLATRIAAPRGDEVGDLARAFNRMAERIETLMTAERRLLQDISHELRSPLTRLQLAIELARTAFDRDQAFTRIQKEVDRLTTLVETLIEMTRAEGDPATRKSQPVELAALVEDVVQSCNLEAQARRCRIVVSGERGGTVSGDPELLRRRLKMSCAMRFVTRQQAVTSTCASMIAALLRTSAYAMAGPASLRKFYRVSHRRFSGRTSRATPRRAGLVSGWPSRSEPSPPSRNAVGRKRAPWPARDA